MNVVLTQPVEIALRTLDEDDRRRVMAWIDNLKNWDKDEVVRTRSQKLNTPEHVYVLKASNDFRIFFTVENDTITVLDIAKKSTIMSFGHMSGSSDE